MPHRCSVAPMSETLISPAQRGRALGAGPAQRTLCAALASAALLVLLFGPGPLLSALFAPAPPATNALIVPARTRTVFPWARHALSQPEAYEEDPLHKKVAAPMRPSATTTVTIRPRTRVFTGGEKALTLASVVSPETDEEVCHRPARISTSTSTAHVPPIRHSEHPSNPQKPAQSSRMAVHVPLGHNSTPPACAQERSSLLSTTGI